MSISATILLHACCGPCSIMPVLRLQQEGLTPVLWYYNPNIHPLAEYLRRREALAECARRLNVEVIFMDRGWDLNAWLTHQLPAASSPGRCDWCCGSRLAACAEWARAHAFAGFSTTLLYSRYQPHDTIRKKGCELMQAGYGDFIYRDFRPDWQEGIDRSRAWEIYRQPYCGCIFSESERYAKKLERACKAAEISGQL